MVIVGFSICWSVEFIDKKLQIDGVEYDINNFIKYRDFIDNSKPKLIKGDKIIVHYYDYSVNDDLLVGTMIYSIDDFANNIDNIAVEYWDNF